MKDIAQLSLRRLPPAEEAPTYRDEITPGKENT
jgi:hypothetical protein